MSQKGVAFFSYSTANGIRPCYNVRIKVGYLGNWWEDKVMDQIIKDGQKIAEKKHGIHEYSFNSFSPISSPKPKSHAHGQTVKKRLLRKAEGKSKTRQQRP